MFGGARRLRECGDIDAAKRFIHRLSADYADFDADARRPPAYFRRYAGGLPCASYYYFRRHYFTIAAAVALPTSFFASAVLRGGASAPFSI